MIAFTVFLAGVCTILLVLLLVQDNKNTSLAVENESLTGVRFFVAALDAHCASFSNNLPRYLSIIDDGRNRMSEIYERLVKEKEEASRVSAPILLAEPQKKKVLS